MPISLSAWRPCRSFPAWALNHLPEGHAKPSLDAILTTPVHEGGGDAWTRFEGASAAIGHYVRTRA